MSDGCGAYTQEVPGILERYKVDHSIKEWTKQVEATFNVETGEKRGAICSTNMKDGNWRKLKRQVPEGLGVSTPGMIKTKMMYIRSAQWRMMVRGEDRWEAFLQAHARWRKAQNRAPEVPAQVSMNGDEPTEDSPVQPCAAQPSLFW